MNKRYSFVLVFLFGLTLLALVFLLGSMSFNSEKIITGNALLLGDDSEVSRSFVGGVTNSDITVNVFVFIESGFSHSVYAVEESVPAGLTIVDRGTASQDGNVLKWHAINSNGISSAILTYTVRAVSPGTYNFSGVYGIDGMDDSEVISGPGLIVTDPVLPCDLTSAQWSASSVDSNVVVSMIASGTNCEGEYLGFSIYENDPIGDDFVVTSFDTFPSAQWTASWISDGGGNPEFYFDVFVVSDPSESVRSGDMVVTEGNAPTSILSSPANNYIAYDNADVTFSCSGSDESLESVSLYGDWSGGWHSDETRSISGTSSSVSFTRSLSVGNYRWNCRFCDSSGNCNFASANRSISVRQYVPPCDLTSAQWSASSVDSNVVVNMIVSGTNCAGEALSFSIYENDAVGDDFITTVSGTFPSAQWITTWVDDGFGNPEFYFDASLVSNPSESVRSGDLIVSEVNVPLVTLISPAEGYSSFNNEVTLSCSATDESLESVVLYGNWLGGWNSDESRSISGTSSSVDFVKTLPAGDYTWNCYFCDTSGNCEFAQDDRSFSIREYVAPCDLTSAFWSSSGASNNTVVFMNVSGTNCNLASLNFSVWKSSPVSDYVVHSVLGDVGGSSWLTSWNGVGGSIFYFKVYDVSNFSEIESSEDLEVFADGVSCEFDSDSDGYGVGAHCFGIDCNDSNSSVHQNVSCNYDGVSCGAFSFCSLSCPSVPVGVCVLRDADVDQDYVISTEELDAYFEDWASSSYDISISDIIDVVNIWVRGGGYS